MPIMNVNSPSARVTTNAPDWRSNRRIAAYGYDNTKDFSNYNNTEPKPNLILDSKRRRPNNNNEGLLLPNKKVQPKDYLVSTPKDLI
eukprot:TRINITY_DN4883_c0_g1_i1.p1 TRINITY_DN4883_c0_g1~~TRINITY_DN4883_c0_g1_i1.p1  ORF type:complete len:87 (-),score=3.60 TRINITY_DN4883_c0_g1_i1:239-499(-)